MNVRFFFNTNYIFYFTGTITELEGMFVAEGILFFHILRDDVDLTHVNRIRNRSPQPASSSK